MKYSREHNETVYECVCCLCVQVWLRSRVVSQTTARSNRGRWAGKLRRKSPGLGLWRQLTKGDWHHYQHCQHHTIACSVIDWRVCGFFFNPIRIGSESADTDSEVQRHCSSGSEAEPEKTVLGEETPPLLTNPFTLSTSFEEDVLDLKWRQSHHALLHPPHSHIFGLILSLCGLVLLVVRLFYLFISLLLASRPLLPYHQAWSVKVCVFVSVCVCVVCCVCECVSNSREQTQRNEEVAGVDNVREEFSEFCLWFPPTNQNWM